MLESISKALAEAISHPVAGYAAALVAGLVSSLAPCTMTAMAVVVGYVGSSGGGDRRRSVSITLSFFLGLTAAFVVLGLIAQGLGFLFSGPVYKTALGLIVMAMGLSMVGLFSFPSVSLPKGSRAGAGPMGAFLLGLVTATVSAPCATPALIAVLALASSSAAGTRGALLTLAYAVGHWAPVIVAGLSAGLLPSALKSRGLARWAGILNKAMGAALIAVGFWMAATSAIKLL